MADFKAPTTIIFNGEQFDLSDGDIITLKGGGDSSFNIRFSKDLATDKYECDKSFADIITAISGFSNINIKSPTPSDGISYNGWHVKDTDNSTYITFANGYYVDRRWVEETITMLSTYVSGATLDLVKNVVKSRNHQITYDVNDATYVGAWPLPRLATEKAPFNGEFAFTNDDNVVPTGTVDGQAFKGWFYDAECTRPVNFSGDVIEDDVRIYADWGFYYPGLRLTANEALDIRLRNEGGISDIYIYTNNDGETWGTIRPDGTSIPLNAGESICIGVDSEISSRNYDKYVTIEAGGSISVSGNAYSMITPDFEELTDLSAYPYALANLFANCTTLVDASELKLPAATLSEGCYRCMFLGCTNLTSAPELPATAIGVDCYGFMFKDCTSLTECPELPATVIKSESYMGMFQNCTSLTVLPELPATTLAGSCYAYMFEYCTNIKLSEIQIGEYTKPYRMPTSGTATGYTDGSFINMFVGTGGTFIDTPLPNKMYYTVN